MNCRGQTKDANLCSPCRWLKQSVLGSMHGPPEANIHTACNRSGLQPAVRDGFGNKHGQRKWVEKIHTISRKPGQDAASLLFSFHSCIHSKLIESLRFAKRTMVHEAGRGLPSSRITAASLQSRTWAMTGQPGLLEERMSVERPYSLSFLIYPVLILLVLVL